MIDTEAGIVPHLPEMIAYATPWIRTTLLTNGMLWRGARLERLAAVNHPNLSLDSSTLDLHDYPRGAGTWAKTVAGIRLLRERAFRVRTGTTETLHTRRRLEELTAFLADLGIPPEDQIVRPLAMRGVSKHGASLSREDLVLELTVDLDGVYWHPIMGDDLRISDTAFPFRQAMERAERLWHEMGGCRSAQIFRWG